MQNSCNEHACAVDCQVDDWSDWSECNAPCGAGTYWNANLEVCLPAPATSGEGNGLNNLNPRFFDLNGDGLLDVDDFLNLLNVLGKPCGS